MAGYQDWMNPNPQAAHMDSLLNNPAAGVLGERKRITEKVPRQWQLPWKGPEGFVTDIPGNAGGDPLRRENMMIPPPMRDRYPAELGPDGQMQLRQAANAGVDMGGPATPPGTTDEFMNNEWVPHQFNMESISTPVEELLTYNQEPIPQIQRPARPVVPFPEGESLNKTPIANSFMDKIKSMFGRGMEAPAFNMESTMVPFEDEEYFGAGRGAGSMNRSRPPAGPAY